MTLSLSKHTPSARVASDLFRTEYTPQTGNEQDAPLWRVAGSIGYIVFELLVNG